jgi:phosphoadenosine phosphosulfate reductase
MIETDEIEHLIADKNITDSLKILAEAYPDKIVFSTSFAYEDQAISHLIFSNNIPIEVFTLDTGRHFAETYSVWNATLDKYKKPIKAYYPKEENVQKLVSTKGPNSFYESVENRKECCFIRKVEPLRRALNGKKIWVTGIRAEQSANRKALSQIEWDETNKIYKYHPLLNWKLEEVKAFIKEHNIPYNPLHDKGFASIGCAPCTRAIKPGEDFRAGRWWWENSDKKECGLHENRIQVEQN